MNHGSSRAVGWLTISVAACSLAAGGCHLNRVTGEGTAKPQRAAATFDRDFQVLPWELPGKKEALLGDPSHGVASLAECGFTTAAFPTPAQLPLCERVGLRAIVARPGPVIKWRELSDQGIFDTVKKLVHDAGDSPALIGYFLADEPGVRDFPALAKAVAAVKKLAPGKLAYVNLYPNYATLGAANLSQLGTDNYADYLEHFIAEVKPQVLSYDNYQVEISADLKDQKRAARYFDNLLEVRRAALAHGLPFWNIVPVNQIRPHATVPSPANLLMQAYTTLAAGARGLTWFTYYQSGYHYAPVDEWGNRTVTWSYLRMVNEQIKTLGPRMTKLRSTGVYFTSPPPVAGAPPLPGRLLTDVQSGGPVMIGEFAGDGVDGDAVMLVNLSLEHSSKLLLKFAAASQDARLVSPVGCSLSPLATDGSIWLAAGQGALILLR